MKLWTCLLTINSIHLLTQVSASSPNEALEEFLAGKPIERTLGVESTSWSQNAPNRRIFGPDMNDEFVGVWDFTISNADSVGFSGQLVETVEQPSELPEDEI